jgi:uncharacterized protein (TIGR03083 family)
MALSPPDPDAVALAALHAVGDDAAAPEPAVTAAALGYAETVAALAEAVASPPTLGLRGRVLAAAFASREPGGSIDDGGADAAPRAFARTVAELDTLLGALDDDDWDEPAHSEIGRVRDVVAHLLAIELYVLDQLLPGDDSPPAETMPHVAFTRELIALVAEIPVDELRHRWRQAAESLAAAAEDAPPDTHVLLHTLRVRVDSAMFMRTFELWAHLDDIAQAVGRRRPRLDARRLRAMSVALVEVLPFALTMTGRHVGGSVHLVLTGPGGGDYGITCGVDNEHGGDRPTDATIVVDVVDLCRRAAQRTSVAQIDVRVEGERPLADAVLASASAFAMD